MNILLSWDAPVDTTGVTGYRVYHGKTPDGLTLLAGIDTSPMVVYPDQLGFSPGDTVYLAVATVNPTGESEQVLANAVILPVPLPLPLPPRNVVAVLVAA